MSNKDFLKSNEFQFLNLNTDRPFAVHFGRFQNSSVSCLIYNGEFKVFHLLIKLGKRKLTGELFYHNILDCLHSPYELQCWCPSVFKGNTNYFGFIKGLERDLNFVSKQHPNLFLPF